MSSMLDQIKSLGFNSIRVPFSNQLFLPGNTPNGIDFNQNPDLVGLTGPQILDKLVAGAKSRGLRIILDRHRPDANGQSPLWYTDHVSEQQWISDWTALATHFANEPTVIGADLHNEPHAQATWGDGNMQTDWKLAAQRCGNAILGVNPNWLIIVEGIEVVSNNYYWWGGNLRSAGMSQVQLDVPNRVVYSPHDYPPSVYNQSWFLDPSFPSNLPGLWDQTWGYLAEQNIAPVWIGEFGSRYQTPQDQKWMNGMVSYIQSHKLSFAFWSWNADSGDTGGILADDWMTVNQDKVDALKPALAPMIQ
jgi:endoglucanase